jgi:hypothetical protein
MARIPKLGTGQRISPQVGAIPSQSIGGAAILGKAQESVGKAISGLASVASNFDSQLRKAEDQQFVDINNREYRNNVKAFKQQRSVDLQGDLTTLGTDVENFAATEMSRISALAPSDRSKSMFSRSANISRDAAIKDANIDVGKFRVDRLSNSLLDSISRQGQNLYDNPSVEDSIADSKLGRANTASFLGPVFSLKQSEAIEDKRSKINRDSVMNGMIDRGLYTQARDAMGGNYEDSTIFLNGMTPSERHSFEARISTGQKKKERLFVKAVKDNKEDLEARLATGEPLSVNEQAEADQVVSSLARLPKTQKSLNMIEDIETAKIVGDYVRLAHGLKTSDLKNVEAKQLFTQKDSIVNFRSQSAALKSTDAQIERMKGERKADAHAYVTKHHPDVTDEKDKIQLMKDLEIDVRYMDKETSEIKSNVLKEAITPEQYGENLDVFQASAGELGGKQIDQMVKDGNLDESYIFASYFNSPKSKSRILHNSMPKIKSAIKTEYESPSNGNKSFKDLTKSADKRMKDVKLAFRESSDDVMKKSMVNSVAVEAARLVNNEGLEKEDALVKARKTIIDDNFSTISEGSSHLMKPRELFKQEIVEVDGKMTIKKTPVHVSDVTVRDFLSISMEPKLLARLPLSPARHIYDGTIEDYMEDLADPAAFAGRWVNNRTQDGILLRVNDSRGNPSFAKDTEGNPIEVKYIDMFDIINFDNEIPTSERVKQEENEDLDSILKGRGI